MPYNNRFISLDAWIPNLGNPAVPVVDEVVNVIPEHSGFDPVSDFSVITDAALDRVLGSYWAIDPAGNAIDAVATINGLFVFNATNRVWVDVTPEGFVRGSNNLWSFVQAGKYIVGTASSAPQLYAFDLSIGLSDSDNKFVAIEGSPNCSLIDYMGEHLVCTDLQDGSLQTQWSAIGNIFDWDFSLSTLAGIDPLEAKYGQPTGIIGGETNLIFQETGISRVVYTGGSPSPFNFQIVSDSVGTYSAKSICRYGKRVFFYSPAGFHVIDEAGAISQIGAATNNLQASQLVNDWVKANVIDIKNMYGIVNPVRNVVMWSININTRTYYDAILLYRFDIDKWSVIYEDHYLLASFLSESYSIDQIDSFFGVGRGIDDSNFQVPFDSTFWQSDLPGLYLFNTDGKRGVFNGPKKSGSIKTNFIYFNPSGRVFVNLVSAIIDEGNENLDGLVLTMEVTEKLTKPIKIREKRKVMGSELKTKMNMAGKYVRLKIETTGDYKSLSGLEVRHRPYGRA